jgi:Ca-activated chloride channel family protein
MAEALGWPDKPIGWDEIVALSADPKGWGSYGHPEWGEFKFGHAHPEQSTTGFTMMATLAYNALDRTGGLTPELVKSDPVREAFRVVEAHTYHYGIHALDDPDGRAARLTCTLRHPDLNVENQPSQKDVSASL